MKTPPAQEKPLERIRHLELLIENMGNPMGLFDQKGVLLLMNKAAATNLGGEPKDFIGKSIPEYLPENAQEYVRRVKRVFKTGRAETYDDLFDLPVGKTWLRSEYIPIPDEDEKVQAVQIVSVDITERKRSEETLRESESRYRQLFGSMISGFALHEIIRDENGAPCDYRFLEVNPAFEQLTGLSSQEVVGKTVLEIMPETEPHWIETYGRVATTGEPVSFESYSGALDRHFEITAYSPGPEQFATVFHDITESKRAERDLRETILRHQEVVKAANVGLWDWDLVTNKVHYSDEWKRQIGYEPHEISDDFEEWRGRIHPDDLEATVAAVRRSIEEKRQDHYTEFRFRHKDGPYRWILVQASVFADERGRPVRMLGSHVDITERKKAEEALRQSEEKYRDLVENLNDVLFTLNAEGIITYASPPVQTVLGYTPEELVGSQYARLIHPDDLDVTLKAFKDILNGRIYSTEFRIRAKNGDYRWVRTSSRPFTVGEEAGGMHGVLTDITDRKLAEEALRDSEERYRLLFDASDTLISVYDAQGVCLMMNQNVARWFDGSPEQFVGKSFADLHHSVAEEYTARVAEVIRTGEPKSYEDEVAFPGGDRWLFTDIYPLKDSQGQIHAAQMVSRDITELKQTEQALIESQRILDETGRMGRIGGWEHDLTTGKAVWTKALYDVIEIPYGQEPPGVNEHLSFYPEKEREILAKAYDRAVGEGVPIDLELQAYTVTNKPIWARVLGEPVIKNGKCVKMRGTFQDITERKKVEETLAHSEHILNQSQKMSNTGSFSVNIASEQVIWSEQQYRIFGYEPGEIAPSLDFVLEHVHPDDREDFISSIRTHMAGQKDYGNTYRIIRKDGAIRTVSSKATMISDETGKPTHRYGTTQDITERVEAEEALRESEEALLEAQRIAQIGSWDYDVARDRPRWSPQMYDIMGWDPKRSVPSWEQHREFFHPDDWLEVDEAIQRAITQGEPYNLEFRIIRPDGKLSWAWVRGRVTKDPQGRVVRLRGTVQDITERKKTEKALLESEEALLEAQRIARIGSWDYDVIADRPKWSPQMFNILGWDPKQGEPSWEQHREFFHPDDWPVLDEAVQEAINLGEPYNVEFRIVRPDGRLRWGWVRGQVDKDAKGRVARLHGTMQDITERKEAERALRESELWLKNIFNAMEECIVVATPDRKMLNTNLATTRIFGYSDDELRNQPTEILHVDHEHYVEFGKQIKEAFGKNQAANLEFRAKRKNGEVFPSEHTVSMLKDSDGKPIGILSVVRDITERKNAEQAMAEALEKTRQREKEVRALLEASQQVQASSDFPAAARKLFDNCAKLLNAPSGYVALMSENGEENELLFLEAGGLPCTVDENLPMPIRGLRAECYRTGKPVYDNQFMDSKWEKFIPPGHVRMDKVLFAPLMVQGKALGVIGLANKPGGFSQNDADLAGAFGDIAAMSLRQAGLVGNLKDSEKRFHELFNHMGNGVAIYETQEDGERFVFRHINPAGLRIGKNTADNVIGREVRDVFPGVVEMGLFEVFQHVWRTGRSQRHSTAQYQDERISLWVENYVFKLPNGELVTIYEDLTQQKKAEEQQRDMEAQLRHAQKMEAVGTLAGGIAHDFNNILAAVLGYSELALDEAAEGAAAPEEIKQIIEAANRAKVLVQQILAFSRKMSLEPKPLDLNLVIAGTVTIIERTIPKMISVKSNLSPNLGLIRGDHSQIEQVLLNLAGNAHDAMPEGGELTIAARNVTISEGQQDGPAGLPPGDYVRIKVSDTGTGINQDVMEHIFEPFYTTKEVGKGTGLGLASVYGIVKNHGGHIYCLSEPGAGASFTIHLPVLAADTEPRQDAQVEDDYDLSGSENILLVDDEDALRKIGANTLKSKGYRVTTAATGEEALDIYQAEDGGFDLVVLDLGMPGMGGQRALKEILALNPQAKVVIASGYLADRQVKVALESGAIGYVAKPFKRVEMLATIRNLLDGK